MTPSMHKRLIVALVCAGVYVLLYIIADIADNVPPAAFVTGDYEVTSSLGQQLTLPANILFAVAILLALSVAVHWAVRRVWLWLSATQRTQR